MSLQEIETELGRLRKEIADEETAEAAELQHWMEQLEEIRRAAERVRPKPTPLPTRRAEPETPRPEIAEPGW